MNKPSLVKVRVPSEHLDDYRLLIPQVVEEIHRLAQDLQGLNLVHLNATKVGGGVAETLRHQVALMRDLGFNCSWYTLPKNSSFFAVSKEIHNFLHGKPGELTSKQKKVYLEYNEHVGQLLSRIKPKPHILIIHDPQPAAAASFLKNRHDSALIWRCHIDISSPNKSVWNFLAPYLSFYDRYIFSGQNSIYGKFPYRNKVSLITPAINPFSAKNRPLDKNEAQKILKQFGLAPSRPLVTQISRLDPWKDPWGAVDAYRLAKKQFPSLQLALVAQQAGDDPEGKKIYRQIKKYIKSDPDIFLFVDLENNDKAINAFQSASTLILQKSLKEGFGLTVTEAMWKGAIVIAGNVGGIKQQINNGVDGFLINSTGEMAEKIVYVLRHPEIKEKMAKAARSSVKNNFLLPHTLLKYLKLFRQLANQEQPLLSRLAPHSLSVHPD